MFMADIIVGIGRWRLPGGRVPRGNVVPSSVRETRMKSA